jgi:uncharacterized protein YhdP
LAADREGEPAIAASALARSTGGRVAGLQLRLALLALAVACALFLLLLAAYELAAARVPQHRAALEQLIRHQTGLEIRFAALAVRWGWYGPEARFEDVELGERPGDGLRLRAHRLIVSLDAWRTLRSGHLEARRITLEDPTIDLIGAAPVLERAAPRGAAQARDAGALLLSRWRGGEIDISGGSLRTLLPGGSDAVTLGITHAQLRRLEADWSAEAQVVLPQALGASVHLALQLRARPDLEQISSASLSVEGHHLELAAWAVLLGAGGRGELPRSGTGELLAQARFVQGRLQSASGHIAAESLAWRPLSGSDSAPALEQLRGNWRLRRRAGEWHLSVDALELGSGGGQSPRASASVDFTADGLLARGRARHVALAPLLPLVHACVPRGLPGGLALRGEASEVAFDWNAHREPGARLVASAELQDLAVTDGRGGIGLSALSGRASAEGSSLALTLRAGAARLVRGAAAPLEDLQIDAHLNAAGSAAGDWQLETQDLHIHRPGLNVTASGALSLRPSGSPYFELHLSVRDTDAAVLASLLGPEAYAAGGEVPAALASGRVESGELIWRGQAGGAPWSAATHFAGSLVLRDAVLRESANWPEVVGLSAHLDWRGAHFHALIDEARTQGFALTGARADWDARAGHAANFAGRLAGDAQQVTAWLRSHPQAAVWAPGLEHLDLRGRTVLDLELSRPAIPVTHAGTAAPRVRIAALLDGVELHPVPGLPPLEGLRGTLAFAGGHLQRSTLAARWLDGPASLTVAERREQGLTAVVVSGRGLVDAHTAVQAAAGNLDEARLNGSADWSASLTVVPGVEPAHWQLHADSSLAGIASHLAAPFDKPPGTALPLHVDWETQSDGAQLRIALGERLGAVAALTRNGDTWRIERGAVRLGGGTPVLPVEPVVLLEGHVSRLDLAAGLALWRQAARDAALPKLRGHLTAAELLAGGRRFPEVALTAESAGGAAALRFESPALSGSAGWPGRIDTEHPALLHLTRFNVTQPEDTSMVMGVAAALAPAAQLVVDELQWRGRELGSFSGKLAVRAESLEATDLDLSSAHAQAHGSAQCLETDCKLDFTFDTDDPQATLAALGLAAEVSARAAHLGGELRWPRRAAPSLATLGGSLHMHLEDGVMGSAGETRGEPFPLLSVPALLSGLRPGAAHSPAPALQFERFSADYELQAGEAQTSDLHFDGDAEILVRGRVGLLSGNYDERAWILRGEDRLPAAVRRLGAGPGVAALWLSLRDLLGSEIAERSRAALRLQGSWSDPIVTPE